MMSYHDPETFQAKCKRLRESDEFKAASPIQRTEFMLAQRLREQLIVEEKREPVKHGP